MTATVLVFSGLAVVVIITIIKTAVIVPQQNAYVVERLGKFHTTLRAGFHVLLPFIDTVRYRHSLKELDSRADLVVDSLEQAVEVLAYVCGD